MPEAHPAVRPDRSAAGATAAGTGAAGDGRSREPALATLIDLPRRRSAVLALLALPPLPEPDDRPTGAAVGPPDADGVRTPLDSGAGSTDDATPAEPAADLHEESRSAPVRSGREPAAGPTAEPAAATVVDPDRPGTAAALFTAVTPHVPPATAPPAAASGEPSVLPIAERPDRVMSAELLPRRRPAAPLPEDRAEERVAGSFPVLDRCWSRDVQTLNRLLVGLKAL